MAEPGVLSISTEEPPTPSAGGACLVCDRDGHERRGAEWWAVQREEWLRRSPDKQAISMPEQDEAAEVDQAITVSRHITIEDGVEYGGCGAECHPPAQGERQECQALASRCITEGERLNMRGCLASAEQPYPALRRPMPLACAVRCAVELWNDESFNAASPMSRIAEAARAGSQDLIEKTTGLGASIARWSQGVLGNTTKALKESVIPAGSGPKGSSNSRICGAFGLFENRCKKPTECSPSFDPTGKALLAALRSRGGVTTDISGIPGAVAADPSEDNVPPCITVVA